MFLRAGVADEVVVNEQAQSSRKVLQTVRIARGEQQDEPAGSVAEILAEKFLFQGGELPCGATATRSAASAGTLRR